jgi:uncharacterized protein
MSGDEIVTARIDTPRLLSPSMPGLVLAHGANNDLDHPLLAAVAHRVAADGAAIVLRFNFPYKERGSNSPDSNAVLADCFRRAHDFLADQFLPPGALIFVGGKSIGGRIAAELLSQAEEGQGLRAAGLVAFGYPLHAPGRKDRLHLEPLRELRVPSLFCIGSKDPLCDPDLLRPVLAKLEQPGRLLVIEGGDHSLRVPHAISTDPEAAYGRVAEAVVTLIRDLTGS